MRGMGKRRPRVLGEKKTDLITSPLADSSDHCHAIAPMTPNYFHSPIFSLFFFFNVLSPFLYTTYPFQLLHVNEAYQDPELGQPYPCAKSCWRSGIKVCSLSSRRVENLMISRPNG